MFLKRFVFLKNGILRIVVLAVVATSVTLALPATAQTTSYTIPHGMTQKSAGTTSIDFSWDAVAGAPRYRIQLSKNANMSGASYHRFYGTTGTVKGLDTGAPYFARIRVISDDGANLSEYSQAVPVFTAMKTPSGFEATSTTATGMAFDWDPVANAPGYRIQLSKNANMSQASYYRFAGTEGTIAGLEKNTKYFARVRVITTNGVNLSPYTSTPIQSSTSTVSAAAAGLSIPVNLRSTAQTATSLTLAWDAVAGAPRYRIQLSTNANMSGAKYSSYVSNKAVLTGLKPSTMYYFRVVVVDADDKAKLSDYTQTPYPSAKTLATPQTVDLRAGTFNISGVDTDKSATKGGDHEFWAVRKGAVVSEIVAEDLDVIGLQEANQSTSYGIKDANGKAINQYTDLRNALNDAGRKFEVTDTDIYNASCGNTGCKDASSGASNATRIMYDSDKVQMVDHGAYVYKNQVAGHVDRYLVWAVFDKNGKKFFFATTHLDPSVAATRGLEWQELITQIPILNKDKLPVVVTGDFNSTKYNQPAGDMLPAMKAAGFGDILNQEFKVNPPVGMRTTPVNGWINSFNGYRREMLDDPSTPENEGWTYDTARNKVGNDNDYIFASNDLAVKSWKLVLNFDDKTHKVVGVIPSDHNMLTATVVLP